MKFDQDEIKFIIGVCRDAISSAHSNGNGEPIRPFITMSELADKPFARILRKIDTKEYDLAMEEQQKEYDHLMDVFPD